MVVRILTAALAFALAGAVATLPFVVRADDPAGVATRLVPTASSAAAILGAITWWVAGDRGTRGWHGAAAGAFVGLFAHPLMWALLHLVIGAEAGTRIGMTVGGTLGGAIFFGFFSALAYGPFTTTLGALVGWGLGRAMPAASDVAA